jgi:hypothetical protein
VDCSSCEQHALTPQHAEASLPPSPVASSGIVVMIPVVPKSWESSLTV